MYKLLGDLKDYLKWQDITTDSMIFRMHNLFTTVLLLTFSLVITATQYVGNPIACIIDSIPKDAKHVINTYCWITSTYTMPDAFTREIGTEVAHPGVGNDHGDADARKYYTYYQWVCFALFFQAIACYVPQWLWNTWENGLMNRLVMGMNHGMCDTKEKNKKKSLITKYILNHRTRHMQYVCRYYFCELLCLINILLQLYLMNRFFDGEFLSYGLRVVQFTETPQDDRVDPMVYIFPRVTKCLFHKYGSSGSLQKHDALCILPLNIVNEKTYIFIWFWYLILTFLLICLVLYRVAIIFVPSIRPRLMHLLARGTSKETCQSVSRKTDLGDWWLLYSLGTNLDSMIYREVLQELAKKMGDQNSSSSP